MQSIKSPLLPIPVAGPTSAAFMRAATRTYLKKMFFASARYRQRRTPATVQANYDRHADAYAERLKDESFSFERYVYGTGEPPDFFVDDMAVRYGERGIAEKKIAQTLVDNVGRLAEANSTVLECGSGLGRNVLLLKRSHPNLNLMGLELSSQSVALATAAAARFGVEATFQQCDASGKWPSLPSNISVVYSAHALEMMPRIFKAALENMMNVTQRYVILLEPITEYYPWDLRHAIARYRAYEMDRLRGLGSYVRSRGWKIQLARLLPASANPLNPTVLMVLEKG